MHTPSSTTRVDFTEIAGSAVGDHPTRVDSLGFRPYVEVLAALLLSDATTPPFTLSIEGEWGSGKSSFMLQLEEALAGPTRRESVLARLPPWLGGPSDAPPNPWPALRAWFATRQRHTIRFNAWRHDKQDALWATFALAVAARLRRGVGLRRAWSGDLQLFASRITLPSFLFKLFFLLALTTLVLAITHSVDPNSAWLKYGLNFFGSLSSDFKGLNAFWGSKGFWGSCALALIGVLAALHKIHSPMEKLLTKYLSDPGYSEHPAFIETFHEDFARVVRAYAGRERVFVFVDDLDRCDVPKAAELMQAINLMIADTGNLVFILGMDREKVAAGIALKYKDLITFLPEYAPAPPTPALAASIPPIQPPAATQLDSDQTADTRLPQPTPLSAPSATTGYIRFGSSYLEKFIQLTFTIPYISSPQSFDLFLASLAVQPAPPPWTTIFLRYWLRLFTRFAQRSGKADSIPLPQTPNEPPFAPPVTSSRGASSREERVRRIRIRIEDDNPTVRVVVEMVAPIFGNNPRRLKQFISAFRLALTIHSNRGLLDRSTDQKAVTTPQQIAKVVALLMRFPDLRPRLSEIADLFGGLERDALGAAADPLFQQHGVRKLLRHGVSTTANAAGDSLSDNPFSLQGVDFAFILSVVPPRFYNDSSPQAAPQSDQPAGVDDSPSENSSPAGGRRAALDLPEASYAPGPDPAVSEALANHAARYTTIRHTQPAGDARTRAMTDAVLAVQLTIADLSPDTLQTLFDSNAATNSDGSRIVALAIAAAHVSSHFLPFLLSCFSEFRSPFEHYWCIRALLVHSPLLSIEQAAFIVQSYDQHEAAIQKDPGRRYEADQLVRLAHAKISPAA